MIAVCASELPLNGKWFSFEPGRGVLHDASIVRWLVEPLPSEA
jgi:hypothetical protein